MTMMRTSVLLCFLLLAAPEMISAGEMERRSRIELRMGLRNHGWNDRRNDKRWSLGR